MTQEQINQLVSLFDKMKDLDIDWSEVSNQIENISGKASEYLSSEEGKSFLSGIGDFFKGLIDWVSSLF